MHTTIFLSIQSNRIDICYPMSLWVEFLMLVVTILCIVSYCNVSLKSRKTGIIFSSINEFQNFLLLLLVCLVLLLFLFSLLFSHSIFFSSSFILYCVYKIPSMLLLVPVFLLLLLSRLICLFFYLTLWLYIVVLSAPSFACVPSHVYFDHPNKKKFGYCSNTG